MEALPPSPLGWRTMYNLITAARQQSPSPLLQLTPAGSCPLGFSPILRDSTKRPPSTLLFHLAWLLRAHALSSTFASATRRNARRYKGSYRCTERARNPGGGTPLRSGGDSETVIPGLSLQCNVEDQDCVICYWSYCLVAVQT
jgi:hypothetical protein